MPNGCEHRSFSFIGASGLPDRARAALMANCLRNLSLSLSVCGHRVIADNKRTTAPRPFQRNTGKFANASLQIPDFASTS